MLSNIESTSGVGRTTTASVRWCNVGRFLIAFVPSLLLYHFIPEIREDLFDIFVNPPAVPESPRDSLLLVERLERLPLSPTFYFLVTVFAEIYLGWRWCSYAKLSREIEGTVITKHASGLTDYDWGVIRGLRNRAFHLRTRSWVMLTTLIFLLFGTIYFVIFILPQIHGTDRSLIEEAVFRERYGHILRPVSQGRYWLKMDAKGLELAKGERIITASFAPDGRRGIVGGTKSSVFFTKDGGRTWSRPAGLTLKGSEREYVARVEFGVDDNSETILVVGDEGSVFVTRNEGQTWTPPDGLELSRGETIRTVSFAPDGRRGIAGSTESSVFFTEDGGRTWSRPADLTLKGDEQEYVARVEFGVDDNSETILVVGDEGSVFVTRNEGQTWFLTEGLDSVTKELVSVRAIQEKPTKERLVDRQTGAKSPSEEKDGYDPSEEKDGSQYSFLMITSDGIYILKSHPIEPEQSLISIQSSVRNDDVLRRSVIGKDILTMSPQESPDPAISPGEDRGKRSLIDNLTSDFDFNLTVMRIASMTILFFLVQLLVRLYQYNLRLASFLDSRADAVLLARTFASRESIPFDDLVRSMAPDDYDFKPQPRPLHEAVLNRLPLQRNP